jgi:parallel beta-helix repeat protein
VATNGVNLTEFTIRAGQNSHPICNVWLENVSKCSIHGNILAYSFYGVYLDESNGNSVYENFVTNVSIGICGFRSDWNSVFRNEFVANSFAGINFHLCSFNNVTENFISGNSVGMRLLDGANNNTIHHNNFVNNTVQVYVQSSYNNIWDDGYPSGGSYWSGYGGLDQYNGPYQNMTGSDGIGDTPYVIDADKVDHYPLMNLYGAPPPPTYALTITATVSGTTNPSSGTYCYITNSLVQVTAVPNTDYVFDHWELESINVGSANPYTVLMDKNCTLKAVFSPIPKPPVGGYSVEIDVYTVAKHAAPYLTLIAILAIGFIAIKRKTKSTCLPRKES